MVGRDGQLRKLRGLAEATAAHQPAVVVVLGDAGIGKTRLVDEFSAGLRTDAVLFARAGCAPGAARALPLYPIREILRAWDRRWDERLSGVTSVDSKVLDALLADTAAPPDGAPVAAQAQLFDTVGRLLRDVARARRLVLVIEDLHWADETSRDLLGFLGRSLRDEQLLLLVTARTDDPDYETCRSLVADLTGLAHGTRIELPRLTAAQVTEQVAALRPDLAPAQADVDRVVALSEGVPLLVEEVLDAGLDDDQDLGHLADTLVGHRLARLPVEARTVVESAAVAVLEPTTAQLAGTSTLPPEQFDEAFEAAVSAGILVRRHEQVTFRHALLREAALAATLPNAERSLHRRWAEVIGSQPQGLPATVAAAHHRRAAGDPGGALDAYLAASRLSHRISAYAEEKQQLLMAADLWSEVPDAEARTGTTLSAVLGAAAWATQLMLSDLEDGSRLVEAAIDALPSDASAHQRAMLTLLWHRLHWQTDLRLPCSEVLAAVGAVDLDPASEDAVVACLEATASLDQAGETAAAEGYALRAVERAEALGNRELQARALAGLGMVRARLGRNDEALRDGRRAVRMAAMSGDLFTQIDALSLLGIVEWLAGESATDTTAHLVELLGGDRPGPLRGRWGMAQSNHAELLIDEGRWEEAQAILDLVAGEQMPEGVFWSAQRVADHLSVWRGGGILPRCDGMLPAPDHTTLDENAKLDDLLSVAYTYGDIAARIGDLGQARGHAAALLKDDRVLVNPGYLLPLLLVAARTEADLVARGEDPPSREAAWMLDRIRAPPRGRIAGQRPRPCLRRARVRRAGAAGRHRHAGHVVRGGRGMATA